MRIQVMRFQMAEKNRRIKPGFFAFIERNPCDLFE
jgi:hypothetical protein